ncbi:MAG: hypothetical protein LBV09_08265 [Deferribacteraceae bacterium]|jgi:uncharacterized protein YuzB (UPF0349 family)|nr:hypothetical protein [Deferribacteraceae bacterium]
MLRQLGTLTVMLNLDRDTDNVLKRLTSKDFFDLLERNSSSSCHFEKIMNTFAIVEYGDITPEEVAKNIGDAVVMFTKKLFNSAQVPPSVGEFAHITPDKLKEHIEIDTAHPYLVWTLSADSALYGAHIYFT